MPLDPALYFGAPLNPSVPTVVELIAYRLKSGGFDAFVFEPPGVCPPEWEEARADPQHLYLGPVASQQELDALARKVAAKLGPDYEKIVGFREAERGVKGGVNRRMQRLHKLGATGYALACGADGVWEIRLRRRDLALIQGL